MISWKITPVKCSCFQGPDTMFFSVLSEGSKKRKNR